MLPKPIPCFQGIAGFRKSRTFNNERDVSKLDGKLACWETGIEGHSQTGNICSVWRWIRPRHGLFCIRHRPVAGQGGLDSAEYAIVETGHVCRFKTP